MKPRDLENARFVSQLTPVDLLYYNIIEMEELEEMDN